MQGNVMYYPGSERGGEQGLIDMDDPDAIWNKFLSKYGNGSGRWCEIILGLGAKSAHAFSPATKSLWYILGEEYGFGIMAGGHLGLLRVNIEDIYNKGRAIRELGAAMMFYATRRNIKKYTVEFANEDFGIIIEHVSFSHEIFLELCYPNQRTLLRICLDITSKK